MKFNPVALGYSSAALRAGSRVGGKSFTECRTCCPALPFEAEAERDLQYVAEA